MEGRELVRFGLLEKSWRGELWYPEGSGGRTWGKDVQGILFMYMKFPKKENECHKGTFSIWGRSLQVGKKVETRFVQVSKHFKILITLK